MAEHDWREKPTQLYYAYRGTLMHAEVEKYLANDPLTAGGEPRPQRSLAITSLLRGAARSAARRPSST